MTIKKITHPFQGGVRQRSYTLRHRPLIWECMLGTVYAARQADQQPRYFDYDWAAARLYAGVDSATDLRICPARRSYQSGPTQGRLALCGILPRV